MAYYKYLKFISFLAVVSLMWVQPAFAQSAFEDPGSSAAADKTGKSGGVVDFMPVQDKIDSGSIALGSSSQVVVLFRNDAIKPITAGDISLYPSSNVSAQVSQNQCSLIPLEGGAVCSIALNVKGLQAGRFRIEMLVKHDGRSRLITATVSGNVEVSSDQSSDVISDVETKPTNLDFGDLSESQTMVRSVVLRNITSNPIDVTDVRIEANDQSGFKLQTNCDMLQTGQACLATVSWAPQKKGTSSGMLIIEHDGPTGVSTVPLDGEYSPKVSAAAELFPEAVPGKGLLISTAEQINFGDTISTSSSIAVSLVNVGDVPLTLRNIRMSNSENGVEIGKTGCHAGTVLNPVEACALTLTWSPLREGAIIDDIQILHDGARGILVLPVRGSASRAVNKDSKTIVMGDGGLMLGGIPSLMSSDLMDGDDKGSKYPVVGKSGQVRQATKASDVEGLLDGFAITSLAPRRAIISGPGGSRVVFDGEETIIAGVLWNIAVKNSAVEFGNGNQKVLMLFDKSLSSVNRLEAQSSSGAPSAAGQSSGSDSSGIPPQ